ncbi:MAG: hypothetical protein DMG95_13225 [Acidobacteria bacterium]|nr:MAG: hypothetical protein DMG95_13225 [Acidobacteriota bacterium]
MRYSVNHETKKNTRVRGLFASALVLACAFGTATLAEAQVTPPPTPTDIAVPVGNSPFLVGHAFGSQGYTCLPTSTGGTAWNPTARPEATLFASFFGQFVQIITHFQSINENPKPDVIPPLSGNATWQSSLDSSRVWMVKVKGIDAGSDPASCPTAGSIQCRSCHTRPITSSSARKSKPCGEELGCARGGTTSWCPSRVHHLTLQFIWNFLAST